MNGQPRKKLATYGTQDENKTKQNDSTICVGHCYTQANINNLNKATGGKDESNIVFMRKS